MTDARLMPVQVDVVKEVLVDRVMTEVLAREPPAPARPVKDALSAKLDLPAADHRDADLRMRGIGYLSRVVEAEMFDPARAPMPWLGDPLAQQIASGADWAAATASIAARYARTEPLPKPAPTDDGAASWKVPGPGGHVRHYVVAAAIAEILEGMPPHLRDEIADPAELKRCWIYGFIVRCCEEALPPAAAAGSSVGR